MKRKEGKEEEGGKEKNGLGEGTSVRGQWSFGHGQT